MNKIKSKLSKWFLDLAKKCDNALVEREVLFIPLSKTPMNVTTYDSNHIDILHVQQQISNYELMRLKDHINIEDMIGRKLVDTMAQELVNRYKDSIQKKCGENPYGDSTTYSLELYVCKPQKKIKGDI